MSFDPAALPPCTQEDGSEPGQVFPCGWDVTVHNGLGNSFVMPAFDTYLYADGTLLCPADTWANDLVDGCIPIPAGAPAPVLLTDTPVPTYANETLTAAPAAAAELAVTGADPILWAIAIACTAVGAVLVRTSRQHAA